MKSNTINEIYYRKFNIPLNFYTHIRYIKSWMVNLNFCKIITKNIDYLEYEDELFDIGEQYYLRMKSLKQD